MTKISFGFLCQAGSLQSRFWCSHHEQISIVSVTVVILYGRLTSLRAFSLSCFAILPVFLPNFTLDVPCDPWQVSFRFGHRNNVSITAKDCSAHRIYGCLCAWLDFSVLPFDKDVCCHSNRIKLHKAIDIRLRKLTQTCIVTETCTTWDQYNISVYISIWNYN